MIMVSVQIKPLSYLAKRYIEEGLEHFTQSEKKLLKEELTKLFNSIFHQAYENKKTKA
jgi:hypothetical protein